MQGKRIKIIIVVLAILLAVSLAALVGTLVVRYFYHHETVSVEASGNIITSDSEDGSSAEIDFESGKSEIGKTNNGSNLSVSPGEQETVSTSDSETETETDFFDADTYEPVSVSGTHASAMTISNSHPESSTNFNVTNIFPGDTVSKQYCVKIFHKGDVVVRYHASVRTGYEKLGEALQIKIRMYDTKRNLLYDGPIDDMPESLNIPLYTDSKTESDLYYDITAYLDTSAGNEYQKLNLIADFRWWVEETDNLYIPQTDNILNIYPWICIASASLLLFLILLAKRRKEATDEVEQ